MKKQPIFKNPAHRMRVQTLSVDSILTGNDLPAPDILNTAEIPREDGRPAHGNLLDQEPFKSLVFGSQISLLP